MGLCCLNFKLCVWLALLRIYAVWGLGLINVVLFNMWGNLWFILFRVWMCSGLGCLRFSSLNSCVFGVFSCLKVNVLNGVLLMTYGISGPYAVSYV